MVQKSAKDWLGNLLGQDKAKLKKIIENGGTIVDNTTEVENPAPADELTGELEIKDYPNLEEINLAGNKITKLKIINCPNLTSVLVRENDLMKEIDFSEADPGKANKIEQFHFSCNKNGVDLLNFRNCKALAGLLIPDCGKIKKIKGESDIGDSLTDLSLDGTTGVSFTTTDDLKNLKDIREAVKDLLKVDGSDGKVLPTNADGTINVTKFKEDLSEKSANNSPMKSELDAIINELGLGTSATQAQIIAEIKRLKDIGSSSDYISKVSLTSDAKNSLAGLGVSETDINKLSVAKQITQCSLFKYWISNFISSNFSNLNLNDSQG